MDLAASVTEIWIVLRKVQNQISPGSRLTQFVELAHPHAPEVQDSRKPASTMRFTMAIKNSSGISNFRPGLL